MDAKYKPYLLMGETALRNDLEHSGRRYLTISDDSINLKSAALVHIDKNIENWNVDTNRRYSISHFSAQPEILENINIYMKRILHFFNKQLEICPSCGTVTKPDSPDFKETYICNTCNEVWVKNTCKRNFHPKPQVLPELLKYPSGNYNMQVGTQWNVFCPVCSQDANGNRVQQDIFGRRL
ncbi:hypothetical protein FK545_11230 [Planococcus glaciei]|nr:hypothetical protein [Planococcus glaciei]QDY45787.1 hypothetical protein FK545_11230 [Planococcus glaciei]